MLPMMSSAGVEIWIVPLTPVGAAAWITLNPNTPGRELVGSGPSHEQRAAARYERVDLDVHLAAARVRGRGVGLDETGIHDQGRCGDRDIAAVALQPGDRGGDLSVLQDQRAGAADRTLPPLPSVALVEILASLSANCGPKLTRISLAATLPDDAAVIWRHPPARSSERRRTAAWAPRKAGLATVASFWIEIVPPLLNAMLSDAKP